MFQYLQGSYVIYTFNMTFENMLLSETILLINDKHNDKRFK